MIKTMSTSILATDELTGAFQPASIDADAANDNIVYDGKNNFRAYIVTIHVLHPAIIEHCGFVKLHRLLMSCLCEWHLFGMEKLPGGMVCNILRRIAKNIDDRIGGVQDTSFGRMI